MAEEAQSPAYFIDSSPASAYIPMTADGTPYTGTFESNGQQPNVVYSSPEGYTPVSPAPQPHPELRLMQPAAAHAPASMYQSMPQQPVMVQYSGVPMQGPGGGQLVYVQYPVYIVCIIISCVWNYFGITDILFYFEPKINKSNFFISTILKKLQNECLFIFKKVDF